MTCQAIVHQLSKADGAAVSVNLSERLLGQSEPLEQFLERLAAGFNSRSGRLTGTLLTDSPLHNLPQADEEFCSFSQQLAQRIASALQEAPGFESAYLLLSHHRGEQRDFFQLSWLQTEPQISFNEQLQPVAVPTLGIASMQWALRIDVAEQQLMALKPKGTRELADLAYQALGFEPQADTAGQTNVLLGAFSDYCQQLDGDLEVSETRQRAYEYCAQQAQSGAPVSLQAFSAEVDQQAPDRFLDYLGTLEAEVPERFSIDQRGIRRMIRYSGTMKGISISFSELLLGEQVVFDTASETLLIRELPPTLKKQLRR